MFNNQDGHSTRFFSVDASWLHMDAPHNRVTIVGLALFDRPLDYERLRASLENRLLRFGRFRQRVRESVVPFGLPTWEPDPHFDLDNHLKRMKLPAPGDWEALQRVVEKIMSAPLPAHRPLWRMFLVEKYGTGSALIVCLSHALADGAAMLHVLDTWMGTTAKASLTCLKPEAAQPDADDRTGRIGRGLSEMRHIMAMPAAVANKSRAAAADPVGTAVQAAEVGRALGKLLFIPPDRRTVLSGRCGQAKRAVLSDPIALERVKSVAKALDAKLNDVVLAAVTGSLRDYLLACGEEVRGLNLRAMVPVYLHPWDDPNDLRNGFGLVYLSLPVGVADPLRRLRVLKRRMDAIKRTPEAAVAYGVLFGLGFTPPTVEHLIARAFGVKATAVMTNVKGPSEVRYLAGVPTRCMVFWVPQPAGLGLGVSIISYAGEVTVSLATDAELVPDPEVITAGFHEQFGLLERLCAPAPRKARAGHAAAASASHRPAAKRRTRQPA